MCTVEKSECEAALKGTNQEHILDGFDHLSNEKKQSLSNKILKNGYDFNHLNNVLKDSLDLLKKSNSKSPSRGKAATEASELEPPSPEDVLDIETLRKTNPQDVARLEEKGLIEVVGQGEAAVLLLAGGSGSRLNFNLPKGMFVNPHLKGNKCLFQWHCEKVLKVERLAAAAMRRNEKAGSPTHHSRSISFSSVNSPQTTPATNGCNASKGNTSNGSSDSPSVGESHASTPASAVNQGYLPIIQVLIMTSEDNDETVKSCFVKNKFFGLRESQVHFFQQQSLPCYDEETGKILMLSDSAMCVAPGGNGGVYTSLAAPITNPYSSPLTKPPSQYSNFSSGTGAGVSSEGDVTPISTGQKQYSLLDLLASRGVQQVQIFSVDNLLAKIADPVLYGYTKRSNAAVVVKTVPKESPEERVGVFAKQNQRYGVVEYTEIGPHATEQETGGKLKYNCANIAIHNCTLKFLRRAAEEMTRSTLYHAARKNITTKDGKQMAVKLEAFIFDMFYLAEEPSFKEYDDPTDCSFGFKIMQVRRDEEFAPIKNADSDDGAADSPYTAAQLLLRLHTRWTEEFLSQRAFSSSHDCLQKLAAGDCTSGARVATIEVLRSCLAQIQFSPLVTYAGEGLEPYEKYIIEKISGQRDEIVRVEPSAKVERAASLRRSPSSSI